MKPKRNMVPLASRSHSPTIGAAGPGSPTRRECWGAISKDGTWVFERLEETGTPWVASHHLTGREVAYAGTLSAARTSLAADLAAGRWCAGCGAETTACDCGTDRCVEGHRFLCGRWDGGRYVEPCRFCGHERVTVRSDGEPAWSADLLTVNPPGGHTWVAQKT